MTKSILFIFMFGLFNCAKRPNLDAAKPGEPEQLVTDSIIYEFINFVLGSQSEFMNGSCSIVTDGEVEIVEFLSEDSIILVANNEFLSSGDIQFIKDQMNSVNYFRINPAFLPNNQLLPSEMLLTLHDPNGFLEFWEAFRNKFTTQGYCAVTIPLFSMDKTIAIIEIGYHCGGLCGSGGIYIYKKEMGVWKLRKTLSQWIS